jgi:hypothetical protein
MKELNQPVEICTLAMLVLKMNTLMRAQRPARQSQLDPQPSTLFMPWTSVFQATTLTLHQSPQMLVETVFLVLMARSADQTKLALQVPTVQLVTGAVPSLRILMCGRHTPVPLEPTTTELQTQALKLQLVRLVPLENSVMVLILVSKLVQEDTSAQQVPSQAPNTLVLQANTVPMDKPLLEAVKLVQQARSALLQPRTPMTAHQANHALASNMTSILTSVHKVHSTMDQEAAMPVALTTTAQQELHMS